jgi:hypothetical protein
LAESSLHLSQLTIKKSRDAVNDILFIMLEFIPLDEFSIILVAYRRDFFTLAANGRRYAQLPFPGAFVSGYELGSPKNQHYLV